MTVDPTLQNLIEAVQQSNQQLNDEHARYIAMLQERFAAIQSNINELSTSYAEVGDGVAGLNVKIVVKSEDADKYKKATLYPLRACSVQADQLKIKSQALNQEMNKVSKAAASVQSSASSTLNSAHNIQRGLSRRVIR